MKRALILLLTLSVTALTGTAEQAMVNSTGGVVEITTTVTETYLVTIPANAEIPLNARSTRIGDITLTEARLLPGHTVIVTADVGEDGAGALTHENGVNALAYTLTIGGEAGNRARFESTQTDNAREVRVEIAQAAWDNAPAGAYTDTITFTVTCE